MQPPTICPSCHIEVRPTDYFCYNCGKNLKPKPPSVSVARQTAVYLESIFLPPYGIILGLRYLRYDSKKLKTVGIIAIVLTVLSTVLATKWTLDFINAINNQVEGQMQMYQGLGM